MNFRKALTLGILVYVLPGERSLNGAVHHHLREMARGVVERVSLGLNRLAIRSVQHGLETGQPGVDPCALADLTTVSGLMGLKSSVQRGGAVGAELQATIKTTVRQSKQCLRVRILSR